MPYPAQGLYPSTLLYPLEAGVEFVNFTKDFKRLVNRYGRSLKNIRTDLSFRAILNILSGTKCIGDNRTMKCGDAIAYVIPGLSYEIGDHITPTSGRGEWIIVTERYASRIGDLRIFRVLGLERYTPGATLTGIYTVVEPAIVGADIAGVYALTEDLVSLAILSRYDINALDVPGIIFAGKYNLTEEFVHLAMLSRYDINAFTGLYPSTTLRPSTSLYPTRGPGRAVDIMSTEFVSLYTVTEDLVSLAMLSRYDINALDVPGIVFVGKYNLTEEFVHLAMLSRYDINAFTGLYPSTTLRPSTSLYPTRGPGRAVDIMSTEFVSLYTVTEDLVSLAMLSRYDINALDVPGIVFVGKYNLTEDLVSLAILSRYDINALDVPGIIFAGKYNLTEEFVHLAMLSRYDINAFTGLYPSTTLRPSTSLYPTRGPGRAVDIMSTEFVSLYTVTEDLVSLAMLSRYDINALDVPGIIFAGKYNLTEEFVHLAMLSRYDINALDVPGIIFAGKYNLTEEFVHLAMLSRYDINALDVPGIIFAGKYNLTEEFVHLAMLSRYDINAFTGLYPSTTLRPSTSLYPTRGPGRAVDIMSTEFVSLYTVTEDLVSLAMLSRYDINALDVPGIIFAGKYNLTEEFVHLAMLSRYDINALDVPGIVFVGKYNLTEDLVSLAILSRYDINALDVPGMVLGSKYDIIALDAAYPSTTLYPSTSLYPRGLGRAADIMSAEFVSLYIITKTPAQVEGERAVATGDLIDNYWRPWDDEDLSYYKVHRSLNTGFTPSDANLVGVPSTNAFKHINLAALTQYYFKVCAVTKLGVSGTYSAQFTATTT